jgi:hypothetical protein
MLVVTIQAMFKNELCEECRLTSIEEARSTMFAIGDRYNACLFRPGRACAPGLFVLWSRQVVGERKEACLQRMGACSPQPPLGWHGRFLGCLPAVRKSVRGQPFFLNLLVTTCSLSLLGTLVVMPLTSVETVEGMFLRNDFSRVSEPGCAAMRTRFFYLTYPKYVIYSHTSECSLTLDESADARKSDVTDVQFHCSLTCP